MWSAIKLFLALRPRVWLDIAGLVGLMLLITVTCVGQGLLIADLLSEVFSSIATTDLFARLATVGVLQLAWIGLIVVKGTWAPRVSVRVKEAVRERLTLKRMEIGPGQAPRAYRRSAVDAPGLRRTAPPTGGPVRAHRGGFRPGIRPRLGT